MQSKFLIFILILLFFGVQITDKPFFTKGEAREAVVVQGMILQNNYILPLRNGEEIPSKPPMFHWSAVLTSKIIGLTEVAIRIPSVIYATLCAMLIFTIAPSMTSLILISAMEFSRSATSARVDMCFCFFLTLASLAAFNIINNRKLSSNFLFLSFGLVGSILSKGPAGLAFPVAIAGIYSLTINRCNFKKILFNKNFIVLIISAVIALASSGLWYYWAYQIGKDDFLAVHLARENVGRFVNNDTMPGHEKPFYFSPIYLVLGFLPWSLLLPFTFKQIWQQRKDLLREENRLKLFSLIWFLVYFLIVTLAKSKRVVYLLPAFPALAILISQTSFKSEQAGKICKKISQLLGGLTAIILALIFSYGLTKDKLLQIGIKAKDLQIVDLFFEQKNIPNLYATIFLLFIILALSFSNKFSSLKKLAISMCLIAFTSNVLILPLISKNFSPREFIEILGKNSKLVFFKEPYYAFSFYYENSIPVAQTNEQMQQADYILVSEEKLQDFKSKFPDKKLALESQTPIIHGRYKALAFKN